LGGPTGPHVEDFGVEVTGPLASFVTAATKSWEPVAESFSLVNDLLEWREVKELFSSWSSRLKRARQLLTDHATHVKFSSDGTVNLFLEYNFGIAPLVSDIQAIAASFYKIKTRLRFLKETKGKVTTLHSKILLSFPDTSRPLGFEDSPWNACFTRSGLKYRFIVGAHLYQDLEGLDGVEGFLRAYAGYLGFNKPLRIAWNAVPYSFLVDWCYDTSRILDSFTVPVFQGPWSITQPWWSCKASMSLSRWVSIPNGLAGTPCPAALLEQYDIQKYIRVGGLPAFPAAPLSYLQQLLFGALLYQRSPLKGKYKEVLLSKDLDPD